MSGTRYTGDYVRVMREQSRLDGVIDGLDLALGIVGAMENTRTGHIVHIADLLRSMKKRIASREQTLLAMTENARRNGIISDYVLGEK